MIRTRERISDILSGLNAVRDSHLKLEQMLSGGPASYYFRTLNSYIEGLFSFAKFKVGDRVALAHDIDCNDAPGWLSSEHFLKKGATADVVECDFRNGAFGYAVVFDNETWLDSNKIARPVSSKHEYWLQERDLEPPI